MSPTLTQLIRSAVILLPMGVAAGPVEDYERGFKAYQDEDLITAMTWLRKSAYAGHTPAQVMLAYILDKAEENAEAFELYTQAAEKGDPEGQAGLADMYASGDGIDQDFGKAVRWYTRAAESGSLRSMRVLATAYRDGGLGLEPDREKAIEWLNRGAALGDVTAQTTLREMKQDVSAGGSTQP